MSTGESSIGWYQRVDRITSKRKLDDYDDEFSDLVSVRMRKDEVSAQQSKQQEQEPIVGNWGSDVRSVSGNGSSSGDVVVTKPLHFFVRMMSGGNTIVIHANPDDSVESVHEQIRKITGIPIMEQRLIYRGKQLQCEQKLAECGLQNDAGLQLVGRMRSTGYPKTWQVVNDLVSSICRLCREESPRLLRIVSSRVREFLRMIPRDDTDMTSGHFQVFKSAGAPSALVMLFLSPINGNKACASDAIQLFLCPKIDFLPKTVRIQCAPIVLEFCKLLTNTAHDDALYISCRKTLGSLLETVGVVHGSKYFDQAKASFVIQEVFPFVREVVDKLCASLDSNIKSFPGTEIAVGGGLREFTTFLGPLHKAIEEQMGGEEHIPISLHNRRPCYLAEIGSLHVIFLELLEKTDEYLKKVDEVLFAKNLKVIETNIYYWTQYLGILKELNSISKLYEGAEEKLLSVMRSRNLSLNTLIRYSKRSDDHQWLLKHKDVTFFESRRHLVMMMFPELKDEYEEMHEMLIDRSDLLVESFRYIAHADPEALRNALFMEFKNEEATGPGVLREWFYLVCQAIFNPQNGLFLSCPNDHRRFYPNPASNMNPEHLEYFGFCGRVIALALMHKMQVGIVFDRVFFFQLAGKVLSLDDVRDADPCLFMSCKKILEMDADFLDSDALGLSFVSEVEELGSRRIVELCPGGKGITLNSKNREEYVDLLIQHRFMTSISEQISHFAQGFADILCKPSLQKFFFQSLELEDLDCMLYGHDGAICVKDWKTHTEYNGYKETDRQICWFWKIVENMPIEQQRTLLFFWTSIKYLPTEGFRGLQSRLYIYKASDSPDRLPSSHTCFYRLCLPPYQSLSVMRDRLQTITQEHVSCSFGIW